MNVSVVVPLELGDCEYRQRAWEWVQRKWSIRYPEWRVIPGYSTLGGWRKGVAIINGVRLAPDGIVVIADADVWVPHVRNAVQLAIDTGGWVKPHKRFVRLTPEATRGVIANETPIDRALTSERYWWKKPNYQTPCGGMVIMHRDLALDVPGDPRFAGWGKFDVSWAIALTTLAGLPLVAGLSALHLWHPPQPRPAPNTGSPENMSLLALYQGASGDPERMRSLVEEGKVWRDRMT